VNKLMAWTVGRPFWVAVLEAVTKLDGQLDLDGDGKKEAVLMELLRAGHQFGRRQFNRAVEMALVVLERKKA
jgi:hypothetical protein